jgi:hypothetical protein
MNLTKSIYSNVSGQLYGAQFEPVMIISRRDNVLIVEGVKGRFPVHCDHVAESIEGIEPEQEKEKVINQPVKKQKQSVKVIQNKLF